MWIRDDILFTMNIPRSDKALFRRFAKDLRRDGCKPSNGTILRSVEAWLSAMKGRKPSTMRQRAFRKWEGKKEKKWLLKVKKLEQSLLPCPSCGNKPHVSICVWECCKSSIRNVECDCGVYSGPSVEDWNNRTAEIRNIWDEIE